MILAETYDEEREPTPAEAAKFRRAAKALKELGSAGLYLYVANDTLCLLTGPSHSGGGSARQERIRETVLIPRLCGGDW